MTDEQVNPADLPADAVLSRGGTIAAQNPLMNDPKWLSTFAHKTTVALQRAAHKSLSRLNKVKLFGENADKHPSFKDPVGVQLLFEMRATIKALDEIKDLEPHQKLIALKTRLTGLLAMQQTSQNILAEVSRISANTNRTIIDLARVAKMEDKSDDEFTDAELAP